MRIVVNLNVGLWRLRYRISGVHSEGIKLLSPAARFSALLPVVFGRTSLEKSAKTSNGSSTIIKTRGFAGVRIARREIRPNPKERVVDLDLAIEGRKQVELYWVGTSFRSRTYDRR